MIDAPDTAAAKTQMHPANAFRPHTAVTFPWSRVANHNVKAKIGKQGLLLCLLVERSELIWFGEATPGEPRLPAPFLAG